MNARPTAPGVVTLDSDQTAIVLRALAEAAECTGGYLAACPQADSSRCETCQRRRQAAEGYEAVARHIRGC